tara:strand:- start:480 stop:743 length:264 start_codon:yes stop_codon:yes gene_type:complete
MIKIEKNVPVPKGLQGRPRNQDVSKYDDTINSMEVGDSFEVYTLKEIINARNCIAYNKNHNTNSRDKRFLTRLTSKHSAIYRVWRIA